MTDSADRDPGPAPNPPDPLPWRRLAGSEPFRNRYWAYHRDRVALPDGSEHDYHYIATPGSVMIVPVREPAEGAVEVLMVRQYRYLADRVCDEFPGGGIPAGTSPVDAARAELREETGFDARELTPIGVVNPCKGLLRESCHLFIARGLFHNPATPDPAEDIAVRAHALADVETVLIGGAARDDAGIADGMSLAAWALARIHLAAPTDLGSP
jgi:ADP-ribose pyrophosphatase